MSVFIDSERATITNYTASVKGTRTVVKIEIEVSEPRHLGFLLAEIADAKRDGDARKRAETKAGRQAKKTLMIPDLRGRP